MHTRPVWVEISRNKLIANYLELRRIAGASQSRGCAVDILAVVKANAYGHGMAECARLLVEAGAEWIGVTSVEESVQARATCPEAKILVMSGIWHGEAEAVIEHRLTPVVWEAFHLDLLEAAAQQFRLPPLSISVHLEIDTGMSRQGIRGPGLLFNQLLGRFHAKSPLRLDGVATHFSAPEVLDGEETSAQGAQFIETLQSIGSRGLSPALIHAGNSATLLRGDPFPLILQETASKMGAKLMVRPGLSLYGYAPRFTERGHAARFRNSPAPKLSPVLTWKSRVTSIRNIAAGEPVGYNSTFRATRATTLALLPMGYADGLSRLLSNRGRVLLRGQSAPIAGRVSMDQTILDVTDIPAVAIGDEAVLIGAQGERSITAYDLADLTGTIPYEVLCGIAARVPRVVVD